MGHANQDARLLPITTLHGKEYLVDIENRLFRNFSNADDIVDMHSSAGRRMIEKMQGTEWNCMGISTGIDRKTEV